MIEFEQAKQHFSAGLELLLAGDYSGAEKLFRDADKILPDRVSVITNLSVALLKQEKIAEAKHYSERAVSLDPANDEGWLNLGYCSVLQRRLGDAQTQFGKAIALNPGYAEAHFNLGNALAAMARPGEAQACYRRALEIRADYPDALSGLASLLNSQNEPTRALVAIRQSLRLKETVAAKRIFVDSVKRLQLAQDDGALRAILARALNEAWARPSELTGVAAAFLRRDPLIGASLALAAEAWPRRLPGKALFGPTGPRAFADNPLLGALLVSTPVPDLGLERFLTMARSLLLDAASGGASLEGDAVSALNFYSLLARQCFINEYVFSCTDAEFSSASALREALNDALESHAPAAEILVIAVAAYFPLCSLAAARRLLDVNWSPAVATLVRQQVTEPGEEQGELAAIAAIGIIDNKVSVQVRAQYEENPYPRWITIPLPDKAESLGRFLGNKFPLASFTQPEKTAEIDVLIAGCGTGQQSIDTAMALRGARVLAIDLSLASLAYARRKTREIGLTCIEYRQGDLLSPGALGRSFDVIESTGVLHHLADPWAGWQALLALLRPGGFMRLGFYSDLARRNIVRLRSFIAAHGYGDSAGEIRRCRQALLALDKREGFGPTLGALDFFSTSMCRDMLFHVQEHRMSLDGIGTFVRKYDLAFLGFEIDAAVLHAYRQRFPDDTAATNLAQWRVFEDENPDTFIGMYQFWVQK